MSVHPESLVSSDTGRYLYKSLYSQEDAGGSIPNPKVRLLYLHPGASHEPLHCSIEAVELKHLPSYEAISYVWGSGSEKENIVCDGKRLPIAVTLASALRRVRRLDRTRLVWADAICINQGDVEERSDQVRYMASIYSKVEQVLVWLGDDEDHHAKPAFNLALKVWEKLKPYWNDAASGKRVLDSANPARVVYLDPELNAVSQSSINDFREEIDDTDWGHVGAMFRKPWFSRVWVRQEIGFAAEALIMCGNFDLDWKILRCARTWATVKALQVRESFGKTGLSLFTSPDNWHGHEDFDSPTKDFLEVLVSCRNFMSTDPRDKIFALMSHPSASWNDHVGPGRFEHKDYSESVLKSYAEGKDEVDILTKGIEAIKRIQADMKLF